MSPRLAALFLNDCFNRLLGRLLRNKTRPFMKSVPRLRSGAFQVALGLTHPIGTAFRHEVPLRMKRYPSWLRLSIELIGADSRPTLPCSWI